MQTMHITSCSLAVTGGGPILFTFDCFGTHPADMDELDEIIRKTLLALYDTDWCAFQSLLDDLCEDYITVTAEPFNGFDEALFSDRYAKADKYQDLSLTIPTKVR